MTIGDRIRKKRTELGLTQEEVAAKLGYKSRSSVNKMEMSRNLPLPKVEHMASVLNCTPAYLMGWDDNRLSEENIEMDFEVLTDTDLRLIITKYKRLDETSKDMLKKYLDFLSFHTVKKE